jgi:6-phosphogluconolactonase/glucosamine-6-phosphate isomerase/deaminase
MVRDVDISLVDDRVVDKNHKDSNEKLVTDLLNHQ